MIKISYNFNDDLDLVLGFDTGNLTGYEKATTLKEALNSMVIEAPCKTFAERYNAGEFEDIPFDETCQIAEAVNIVSDLWQYDMIPNPEGKDLYAQMSPLHLLENAMNLLVEKQHEIDRLKNTANA